MSGTPEGTGHEPVRGTCPRRRPLPAVLVLLGLGGLLGGCGGDPRLASADGAVTAPTALEFPRTFVGHPTVATLPVTNDGRVPYEATLEASPPFHVEPRTTLPAPGTREVPVRFEPAGPGPASGLLVLRWDGGETRVALAANAEEPPACEARPCLSVRFDPDQGCVEEPLPDGVDCGHACVVEATCVSGTCVGTAVDCADDDPCTADTCDPARGCEHPPRVCPASDDPCRAPVCDPAAGCSFAPAPDGTACGPGDCSSAHLCLAGVCTFFEDPEGTPCGEATPCRDEGRCRHGVCTQPAPRTLLPAWTHRPPDGRRIRFDGVIDGDGNVHAAECAPAGGCDHVVLTGEGLAFLRRPLADGAPTAAATLLLAGERLVAVTDGRLEGFDRTGPRRWSRRLDGPLLERPVIAAGPVLVVLVGSPAGDGGELRAFGLDDGAPRWSVPFRGEALGLVGDSAGDVHVTLREDGGDAAALVSFDGHGRERFRAATPFRPPLAARGGTLLHGDGTLRRTGDGAIFRSPWLAVPLFSSAPALGERQGFLAAYPAERCDTGRCPSWRLALLRFDLSSGGTAGEHPLPPGEPWDRTDPALTDGGGVLWVEGTGAATGCERPAVLREWRGDGAEGFRCDLPAGGWSGPAALDAGRFLAADACAGALSAFAVDRQPALSGWIGASGDPGRTGRPR